MPGQPGFQPTSVLSIRGSIRTGNAFPSARSDNRMVRETAEGADPDPVLNCNDSLPLPTIRSVISGSMSSFQRLRLPSRGAVRELLLEPLSYKACGSGHLYIFTNPSKRGFIKIGWTSQKVSRRLSAVKRNCKFNPTLVYIVHNVPFAYRVEQLVFADLGHTRYRYPNCSCGVRHNEWFKIDVKLAKRKLLAWSSFMAAMRPHGFGYDISEQVHHVLGMSTSTAGGRKHDRLVCQRNWSSRFNFLTVSLKKNTKLPYELSMLLQSQGVSLDGPLQWRFDYDMRMIGLMYAE